MAASHQQVDRLIAAFRALLSGIMLTFALVWSSWAEATVPQWTPVGGFRILSMVAEDQEFIKELARSLRHDPDEIYRYVHDRIRFHPVRY
ncbi:hypothetical protein [Tardiphaga sp.]|jgi:hypothetical protein|uniref:hypothetical protein n=1 Tax=Tardiphaga sp. TaxID=1926292 RepID=UPI0037DA3CC7